jgi:hypothetical protein
MISVANKIVKEEVQETIFIYNIKPNDIQAKQKDLKSLDALFKMETSNTERVEEEEQQVIPDNQDALQGQLCPAKPSLDSDKHQQTARNFGKEKYVNKTSQMKVN